MATTQNYSILCQMCCDKCKNLCINVGEDEMRMRHEHEQMLCNGCCELCESLCISSYKEQNN